jgi:hypothetical protein
MSKRALLNGSNVPRTLLFFPSLFAAILIGFVLFFLKLAPRQSAVLVLEGSATPATLHQKNKTTWLNPANETELLPETSVLPETDAYRKVNNIPVNNATPTTTTTVQTPNPTELHVPNECIRYVGTSNGGRSLLNLTQGRYIRVPHQPPPYDHTCFILKPRYNCALDPLSLSTAHEDDQAYQWKFVLQSDPDDISTRCDIGRIVDDLGGPSAIQSARKIGIFGNSYLRQIFEAMACKYQSQLTNIKLHMNSPGQSITSWNERNETSYSIEEYGYMTDFENPAAGTDNRPMFCTESSSLDKLQAYYAVKLPHDLDIISQCSDNIALAQFGDTLSVFYNFRPHHLADPQTVYRQFVGINETLNDHFDYRVYNDRVYEPLRSKLNLSKKQPWDNLQSLLPMMRRIQRRDAKRVFGANNPWILDPPDGHPCMPGIPDDELAILLFVIIFGLDGITGI